MFNQLVGVNHPTYTPSIKGHLRSLKKLDDVTGWVFDLVGGKCRICGGTGGNGGHECPDCGEAHYELGPRHNRWHYHAYDILTILYMIHAIDYNEQAAVNNEREINHNLLKIIEESRGEASTNISYVEIGDTIFSNNQLPFGKRNNRAIKQFYEKIKRADNELIKRFNTTWFEEMIAKDKKISKINLYKEFDGIRYLFDMLFSIHISFGMINKTFLLM